MDSGKWLEYFNLNSKNALILDYTGDILKEDEAHKIQRSIRAFQLGEASEGKQLKRMAEDFGARTCNPYYFDAIIHLIREENRHSAYLGKFMRHHGIELGSKDWTDEVFRFLRQLAGLEFSIRVLVTAEIIALTYYDCLAESTSSQNLRTVCLRMVDEEQKHVEFQMHHIHGMNEAKFPLFSTLSNIVHVLVFAGSLCTVWIEHRRVLRTKHSFTSFFRTVWEDFRSSMNAGRASIRMTEME